MPGVRVQQSPIAGLGMFATRPFRAGERILRRNHLREITAEVPLRADLGERPEHTDDIAGGRLVLLGYPDRHFNHRCDPNAYVHVIDGVHYIYARREIAPGEEITNDYAINGPGGAGLPCRCRAARCRGEAHSDFFRLPVDIQLEYLPLLADWFVAERRERINALRMIARDGEPG